MFQEMPIGSKDDSVSTYSLGLLTGTRHSRAWHLQRLQTDVPGRRQTHRPQHPQGLTHALLTVGAQSLEFTPRMLSNSMRAALGTMSDEMRSYRNCESVECH